MLDAYYEVARRLNVPASATLELLSPCNLRCLHCYVTHSKKTALKFPVVVDILDQLAAVGTMTVTFTGGEIGLRKDLFDIIKAARDRNFEVKLLSSGTRWGEAEWDKLAELGVSFVRFSVYGSCAEIHEKVTLSEGSFERTIASALALKARGITVELACSVMHLNVEDVGNVVALARGNGLTIMVGTQIVYTDEGSTNPAETRASFAQLVEMFKDPRVRDHFHAADDPCAAPESHLRPCGVGHRSVFIRSDGNIHPCSRWPGSGGNVLEKPVLEIFRDSQTFRETRAITYASMTGCSGCGDAGSCDRCPAINVQETGSVTSPGPTVCEITAAQTTAFFGHSKQTRFRRGLPIVT